MQPVLIAAFSDDIVRRIQLYVSLRAPSSRDWNSFAAWMANEKPLMPEERGFLQHRDDFVALADSKECGWLDGVVEDTLKRLIPSRLQQVLLTLSQLKTSPNLLEPFILTFLKSLLRSKAQRSMNDDPFVHLISKRRTDVVVRLVLTLTTVGLLVGPSAVLFLVNGRSKLKLLLIMVFVLLFSLAVSVFTKAKRHEMLAATAT